MLAVPGQGGVAVPLDLVLLGAAVVVDVPLALWARRDAPRWGMDARTSFLLVLLLPVIGFFLYRGGRKLRRTALAAAGGPPAPRAVDDVDSRPPSADLVAVVRAELARERAATARWRRLAAETIGAPIPAEPAVEPAEPAVEPEPDQAASLTDLTAALRQARTDTAVARAAAETARARGAG